MNKFIKNETVITESTQTISLGSVDDWSITTLRKICRKNKVPQYLKMDKANLVIEVRKILDSMRSNK